MYVISSLQLKKSLKFILTKRSKLALNYMISSPWLKKILKFIPSKCSKLTVNYVISSPWLKKILKFIPFKCSKLNEMIYVQSCRAPWEYLLPIGAHQGCTFSPYIPEIWPCTPHPTAKWGVHTEDLPHFYHPFKTGTTQYKKCQSRMQKKSDGYQKD